MITSSAKAGSGVGDARRLTEIKAVTTSPQQELPVHEHVPAVLRRLGLVAAALLLGGAAYLIWARGAAILLDLSALAGRVWCF